jgi:hypothetical protein
MTVSQRPFCDIQAAEKHCSPVAGFGCEADLPLYSVRYLRVSSFNFKRLFNSPAVLIGVTAVIILQLMFTYAPFMEAFFDSRPVDLVQGIGGGWK